MKLVERHELDALPDGTVYFPYAINNSDHFGVEKRTTPEGAAVDKALLDTPHWPAARKNCDYWIVLEKADIETMVGRLLAALTNMGGAVVDFMDKHRDVLKAAASKASTDH